MSTTDAFQKDTEGALWYPDLSRWVVEITLPCEVWDEILKTIDEALKDVDKLLSYWKTVE
jgi:hypothetical protein